MTPTKLRELIANDESQMTEFKLESEKQADLAEVIMAFANVDGGYLLVGVTDDGEIVGVNQIKSVVDRIHSALRRIDPSLNEWVSVEQVEVDDKVVIVADIPDDLPATYSVSGKFRIRAGSYSRLMSSTEVINHATQRGMLKYEAFPVRNATLTDLNSDQVQYFLAQRLRGKIPAQPLEQVLQTMGAMTDGAGLVGNVHINVDDVTLRPTVAGLLFFGEWPQLHLHNATILAARIVGPLETKIIDRATIEGTIPELINGAVQFVRRNTRQGLAFGQTDTGQALEVEEYPLKAIREAITNACCHRDYQGSSPIQLKIYDNRIVIRNAGGLLPGVNLDKLEGIHETRNPLLASWLQTLGYIERFGTGVARMREEMENAGLPAPQFEDQYQSFQVTFIGPGDSFMRDEDKPRQRPIPTNTTDATNTTEGRTIYSIENPDLPWYKQMWSSVNPYGGRR